MFIEQDGSSPSLSTSEPLANRLAVRRLAAQVAAAVDQAGARTILVTSPSPGAGKTTLLRQLATELEFIAPGGFEVTEGPPPQVQKSTNGHIRLVEGPSLEAEDFLRVNNQWLSAFDGALIVVMGRVTRRESLEMTVSQLNAAGIPPLGLIFNEHECASLSQRIRRFLRRVGGVFFGFGSGLRRLFTRVPT